MSVIDFCDVMCVSLCVKWQPIKHGQTPLWIASRYGRLKMVEYLATEAKIDPNKADEIVSVTCAVCNGDVVYVWYDGCPHAYLRSLRGDHTCEESSVLCIIDFCDVMCVSLCVK